MADPNRAVEQMLDSKLYQSVCKGVCRLTNTSVRITFEKNGKTIDLDLMVDDSGLAIIDHERS